MQMKSNIILLFMALLSVACTTNSQKGFSKKDLLGFWKGNFPHDPALNMVFYFWEEEGEVVGNSFIAGETSIENEDPIFNVKLNKTTLAFDIPSQGIEFRAEIDAKNSKMEGGAYVPNDEAVHLSFEKVDAGNVPMSSEMIERCKPVDISKKFALEKLQEDFNYLRNDLENSHPQLYLYYNKKSFDEFFDEQYQQITNKMTVVEFARIIAPIIAKIGCGHTQMQYNRKFMAAFKKEKKFLPLQVKVIDQRLFVTKNFSESNINLGAEIVSINNRSSSDICSDLLNFFSSDGKNISFKVHDINRDFAMAYHYLESPEKFEIVLKNPKIKSNETVLLDGLLGNKYYQKLEEASSIDNALLRLDVNDWANYATMQIKSFMHPNTEEYSAFLAESFKKIKEMRIGNLIIDLRSNYGGPPFNSAELLSYIAKEPIIYFSKEHEQTFLDELTKPLEVNKNRFEGKVYCLVDGGCFSSTGHFLSLVKYHKLATIVGEAPGGSFYCNDNSKYMSLPNTKLDVSLAQTTFTTAVNGMEKGEQILPDYLVLPHLQDLLKGEDTQLKYVLGLMD